MVPHAAEIIKWAREQIGVKEDPIGSNNGDTLRHILRRTAFKPGDKWCLFFAEAAVRAGFGESEPIPAWIAIDGSTTECAHLASRVGKLSAWPATGCIALLKKNGGGYHHAAIVTQVNADGDRFTTVEGNTNDDGSTNGYAVMEHLRHRLDWNFVVW